MKTVQLFTLLLAFTISTQLAAQSAHVQAVQNNYAAFGKGDIPTILASLTDDCVWEHVGNPAIVPFAGVFKGKAEIASKFFAIIPTSVQITAFEPRTFREGGNTVIASVFIKGTGITTGKTYENMVDMAWTFNQAGLVSAYKATGDASALEAALTK